MTDRERFLLLNLVPEVGSTRMRRLLDAFGSLERVCRASPHELQQVEGIGPRLAKRIAAGCGDERGLREELKRAQVHRLRIMTLEDPDYPARLKTIHDPPLVLYVNGSIRAADEVAVAIVGSRHASSYGLQSAERLGYELAIRGVTVVSGLARGIDAAAHRGALRASGRTIAVLGSGLGQIYPPEHAPLASQIVEQGALMSEYPVEMQPLAHNFPRRNRIISGLSLGVVVVEAAARSGALISADCALEQGREVFAVPGPITSVTSQGTHQLLKQGAALAVSVDDILEALRLRPLAAGDAHHDPSARTTAFGRPSAVARDGHPERSRTGSRGLARDSALQVERKVPRAEPVGLHEPTPETAASLPELEQRVWACIDEREPVYVDAIASRSGLTMPQICAALLQLELKQLVRQLPGKYFVRRSILKDLASSGRIR